MRSNLSGERVETTTFAPSESARLATARPMPEDPPITTTFLPRRAIVLCHLTIADLQLLA